MYTHVTAMGVSVSEISFEIRRDGRPASEFLFGIVTSYGQEFTFRYQRDAAGAFGWHLYRGDGGGTIPAMAARHRASLGSLPLDFSDSDIDALIRRVAPGPLLTTYVVAPGIDGVDFVVFPLSRKTASFMRAFISFSQAGIGARLAHKASYEMIDARQFILDADRRKDLQNPDSEVSELMERLKKDGYYMYAAGTSEDPMSYVPPFIKLDMLASSNVLLSLEKRAQVRNALLLTRDDRPVARLDNIQAVFSQYELMAANYKAPARRHSHGRKEKDLLADWQRRHDDEKWDNVKME